MVLRTHISEGHITFLILVESPLPKIVTKLLVILVKVKRLIASVILTTLLQALVFAADAMSDPDARGVADYASIQLNKLAVPKNWLILFSCACR